jgi:L-fuconolactonase
MIDAHQHFWKFDPVRDAWITPEMEAIRRDFLPDDLAPVLQRNGVSGCVAVQADQSEVETEFLIQLAETHPFIKGIVGWVDLRSDSLKERLAYFSQFKKLKGFRHIAQGQPAGFLLDQRFLNGVRMLGEFGFTYDLLIYHNQLPEAIRFVSELPNIRIVLDHLAKPPIASGELEPWRKFIAELSKFDNVSCKVSGMATEAQIRAWKEEDFKPYLDTILDAFGPSRIMYGSDWPVCLLSATYEEQLMIVKKYIKKLSLADQHSIMVKNTINFYHL